MIMNIKPLNKIVMQRLCTKLHFLWNQNEDLKLKLQPGSYGYGQLQLNYQWHYFLCLG